jgi:pyruvate carboxylase
LSLPAPKVGDWLALYGSLMRGLGASQSLGLEKAIRFKGPCICTGELFDLGDYPGLRPGQARIAGELYALLDPGAITTLDCFEGFDPNQPRESLDLRERVKLIAPKETTAWIYLYNHTPDASQHIPSGDWRFHLTSRDPNSTD